MCCLYLLAIAIARNMHFCLVDVNYGRRGGGEHNSGYRGGTVETLTSSGVLFLFVFREHGFTRENNSVLQSIKDYSNSLTSLRNITNCLQLIPIVFTSGLKRFDALRRVIL